MKKIISVLLIFVISCTTIIAYSENSQINDIPPYDYLSFVGEWHKIDPDGLNGDVPLQIMNVTGNKEIVFSLDNGGEIVGTIQDNQVKWTEEWYDGSMGLTLTFYDDHIHLQYSRYSDKWYTEITFVSDHIKPYRITTDDYSVILNGEKLEFDQPPIMSNDRILVPMRTIFEALGADVEYDSYTDTVLGHHNAKIILIRAKTNSVELSLTKTWFGNWQYMIFSGDNPVNGDTLSPEKNDALPIIINGRTLVPIRFISEAFAADVDWDSETQTVIISTESKADILSKEITIDIYEYSYDYKTLYIESTINTNLDSLNESLKTILEGKNIPVKKVYSYPDPEQQGYDIVVDLDYDARNKFYSLYLQDEIRATIFSIDEVYKYALLLDGNAEWYDGHTEGRMGDWQIR